MTKLTCCLAQHPWFSQVFFNWLRYFGWSQYTRITGVYRVKTFLNKCFWSVDRRKDSLRRINWLSVSTCSRLVSSSCHLLLRLYKLPSGVTLFRNRINFFIFFISIFFLNTYLAEDSRYIWNLDSVHLSKCLHKIIFKHINFALCFQKQMWWFHRQCFRLFLRTWLLFFNLVWKQVYSLCFWLWHSHFLPPILIFAKFYLYSNSLKLCNLFVFFLL